MKKRDLRTVDSIAREIGVSRMTVYRAVHDGSLPHIRIRHLIKIRQEDFETWLNEPVPPASTAPKPVAGDGR